MNREEKAGDFTWKYSVHGDSVEIKASSWRPSGVVIIPYELDGKPVTSIGSCVFFGCKDLTQVIIPDSVTSIGDWAFHGCTGLVRIKIPDFLTDIGEKRFTVAAV